MADHGVAVSWGDAKPGREKKALELWADAVVLNDKAVADSRISSWDAIVLDPSPTPPAGVTRIYGAQDQIEQFIRSDDFQGIVERATLLLNNVGLRRFMSGEALAQAFTRYASLIDSL
jgi:hypothetical protein